MTPAPRARLGRTVALIVLVSLCGCADGRSLLTLSIDASAAISGIDHLRVLLTDTVRGKTASEIDVPVPGGMLPPMVTANIALNAQVKGTVAVAVDAIESSGKVLGSGTGSVSVAPSKTATVGVTLAPSTSPGTLVATSLAFMAQPTSALTDDPLGTVAVQVLDQNGALLSTSGTSVAVAIGKDPSGGFLSGPITVAAVNGVATFSGLSINEVGSGYSLVASVSGLPSVTSNAFNVTPRPFHEINSGLEGGYVESMALASADPSVMYITCVGGGVFKSLDGGAHWVDIDSTLTALNYLGITADPRNADSIWMTTGSGALVHSSDGGASWSTAASGLPASPASSIVVDPTASSTVYVATSGQGIYKATDGITFTNVSTGLGDQNVQDLIMSPQSPTTLYAATRSGGVFKSIDGGGSWAAINSGLSAMDASQIVADPTIADQLYVAISDNTKGGVFKSTNGGISWTMASSGFTDLAIHSLALDPSRPGTLWAGSYFGALYHSTNGGASWSIVAAGLPGGQRLMGIVVSPTTGQVFVGMAGGGVWTSPDGGATWAASNGGLGAVQPGAILIDPVDSATIYAGTTNGAYKSSDAGASWKQLTNGNATFPGNVDLQWYGMAADKSTTPPTIYGAVLNVGVLKSTDAGVTWTTLTGTQLDLVGLVTGAPIAPSTLATLWTASQSSNQAYRSTDGGATWTIVTVASVGTLINGIAIDPTNSNNLYLATSAGVYKSTNASAASVSFALSSMGINSSTLNAIAIDPVTPTTLYAGDRDGQLVKSIDGAQNWIQIGSANANVTALAVDPNNQASIYLSTFGNGLLKSINDGSSFNSVTQQHYRMYMAIAIDRVNPGTVYAASYGKGIFKTTSSGM